MPRPMAIVGSRVSHLRLRMMFAYSPSLRGRNSTLMFSAPCIVNRTWLTCRTYVLFPCLKRGQGFTRLVSFGKVCFLTQPQSSLDFSARAGLVTLGREYHSEMKAIGGRGGAVGRACRCLVN